MKLSTLAPFAPVVAALVMAGGVSTSARATVVTGNGGQGVPVGQSSLIGPGPDYGDTFTQTDQGGQPNRPSTAAVQPAAAYVVENTYGNPSANFRSQSVGAGQAEFSFCLLYTSPSPRDS